MLKATPSLRIHVDQSYKGHVQEIQATISQILEIAGWQSVVTESPQNADLIYAPGSEAFRVLPGASPEAWGRLDQQEPIRVSNLVIPADAALSNGLVDVVLASAFLLSGRHERQANVMQNQFGVPSNGLERWGLKEQPTVLHLARKLRKRMSILRCFSSPRDPWPKGKRWALCLTHDCDRIYKFDARSRLRNVASGIKHRERLVNIAKLAYSAVAGKFAADPYWSSWLEWLAFEREMSIPSTYYVATRSRDRGGVRGDVGYYASDTRIKQTVQQCLDDGCELGLHSSIGCWQRSSGFAEETAWFTQAFGQVPLGFRAHCWSLNPKNQEESLCMAHDTGGLIYDTSLGMNEIAGFRRGTAYPYRLFDRFSNRFAGLIEIPPTIMDASLLVGGCVDRGLETLCRLAETTKQNSGVFVLDWHSDSLCAGYQMDLARRLLPILQNLVADSTCWVTTPARVAQWCVLERWGI